VGNFSGQKSFPRAALSRNISVRGITPKPGFAWSAGYTCTDEESEKGRR